MRTKFFIRVIKARSSVVGKDKPVDYPKRRYKNLASIFERHTCLIFMLRQNDCLKPVLVLVC